MDASEELRLERCALCQALFWICRPCYRGQGFCTTTCKLTARTSSKRRARSRHRQSVEGRLDHRDRERERRHRARVADHTARFLAAVTRVCPPPDPVPPISGETAVDGKEHDEARVLDDDMAASYTTAGPATCRICFRPGVTVTHWARRRGSRHRDDHARRRRVTSAGP